MKQQSDLVRDLTDPGWREREADVRRRLMEAVPQYPTGDVAGPCVCGSWPGGKCLRCPVIHRTTRTARPADGKDSRTPEGE